MGRRGGHSSPSRSTGQHRVAAASYRSSAAHGASRSVAAWGARGAAAAYGATGTKRAAAAGAYKTALAHGATKHQAKSAARGAAAAISGINVSAPLYNAIPTAPLSSSHTASLTPHISVEDLSVNANTVVRFHTFENAPYYVGVDWRMHIEGQRLEPTESCTFVGTRSTETQLPTTRNSMPTTQNKRQRDALVTACIVITLLFLVLALT